MSDEQRITFTPTTLRALERAYKQAVEQGRDEFVFDGHGPLVTSYAGYLIEYLKLRMKAEV